MLKNAQTYFKNLAVSTVQDLKSKDHFSTLFMKGFILEAKFGEDS